MIREAATEAQIPARNGYIGVLPGHAPLLSELGLGYASYVTEGRKYYFAVHGGFVEVPASHSPRRRFPAPSSIGGMTGSSSDGS